ncbi:hypothetical protein JAAARDRAFT_586132 [Jaapia argillacea MUCL 33604]|uniref:Uncharacterized protein n=1 Tax=Jaapia argillacea MUCL 33604 TaxID=933084 RepID=A0A067P6D4_9AGAM|nr:hypothetical protein JAAARDRAFT_586132 [Jaapia argillacea MUCL 33604]
MVVEVIQDRIVGWQLNLTEHPGLVLQLQVVIIVIVAIFWRATAQLPSLNPQSMLRNEYVPTTPLICRLACRKLAA